VTRRVYEAALAAPGDACRELAERLGLNRKTVHYHLQQLARAGHLVARDGPGGARYFPARPLSEVTISPAPDAPANPTG
jgi:predicted transcriptional regulator